MLAKPVWCQRGGEGCKGMACKNCRARKVVWGLKMNHESATSVPDQQTWRALDNLCPKYRAKCERGGENGWGDSTYMPCSVCFVAIWISTLHCLLFFICLSVLC